MTPEFPTDPTDPRQALEASLTALLLGELPADQAAFLEQAIASDAELAKTYERLKQTIELVHETEKEPMVQAGKTAAPLKLSEEKREALLAKFKTVRPKEFERSVRRRYAWLVPVGVAAGIVAVAGLFLPVVHNFRGAGSALSALYQGGDRRVERFGREIPDVAQNFLPAVAPPAPQASSATTGWKSAIVLPSRVESVTASADTHSLSSGSSDYSFRPDSVNDSTVLGGQQAEVAFGGTVSSTPMAQGPSATFSTEKLSDLDADGLVSGGRGIEAGKLALAEAGNVSQRAGGKGLAENEASQTAPGASKPDAFRMRYGLSQAREREIAESPPTRMPSRPAAKPEAQSLASDAIAPPPAGAVEPTTGLPMAPDVPLVVRKLSVDGEALRKRMEATTGTSFGGFSNGGISLGGGLATVGGGLRGFYEDSGVNLTNSGTALFYNDREGTLFARATPQDLDKIDAINKALSPGARAPGEKQAMAEDLAKEKPALGFAYSPPVVTANGVADSFSAGHWGLQPEDHGGVTERVPILGDRPVLGKLSGGRAEAEQKLADGAASAKTEVARGSVVVLPTDSSGWAEELGRGEGKQLDKQAGEARLKERLAEGEAASKRNLGAVELAWDGSAKDKELPQPGRTGAGKPAAAAPANDQVGDGYYRVGPETRRVVVVPGKESPPIGMVFSNSGNVSQLGVPFRGQPVENSGTVAGDVETGEPKRPQPIVLPSVAKGSGENRNGVAAPAEPAVNEAVSRQSERILLRQTMADAKIAQDRKDDKGATRLYADAEQLAKKIGPTAMDDLQRNKATRAPEPQAPVSGPSNVYSLNVVGYVDAPMLPTKGVVITTAPLDPLDTNSLSYSQTLADHVVGYVNVTTPPTSLLAIARPLAENPTSKVQTLADAQRKLDEAQRFSMALNARIEAEKTDLQLPKLSMVEIVDQAVPAEPRSPGLLGRVFGAKSEAQSTARIKVERDAPDISGFSQVPGTYDPYFVQSEFETIQSEAVLGKVVDELKLDEAWGQKNRGGGKLTKSEAVTILKQRLELRPVKNTSLVEINVKSDKPDEAAKLANTIARIYTNRRRELRAEVTQGGINGLLQSLKEREKEVAAAQAEVDRLRAAQNAQPAQTNQQTDVSPPKVATPPPVAQPEVQTRENAFSTFSMNVSDVSFKLAAASLEKDQLPEPGSIRSEEFINAFDYRDPEAPAGVPVAFAWERARYPFAQGRDLLRFSIKTAAAGRQAGRPLNLVLLLDNSGSMERADRVRIIQEALRVLASQLQAQDTLSVVTFARTPRLWVDGVPGDQAGKVAEEVGGLTPQGGTNLGDALDLAYQTARRHYLANGINRVVLLTDGAANLGEVEPESLKQRVETNRKQGIALDGFGIGWEGYNDDLLEALTRNGDGRYGFINTPEEAATEFAAQLAGALQVAASDVKVQVEFNPGRVTAYRQIGYAKHQLTKEQFRDNTVDAAELAAAETGNALYVIDVNGGGDGPLATVRVRYKVPGTADYREQEWTVPYTGNAVGLEQAGPAMRLVGAASAFSEWLATSPYAAEVTPDRVLEYLRGVPEVYGADVRPKKLEWMVRQARSVGGK